MFDLGDSVPLTITIRNPPVPPATVGEKTNATSITLTIELPDGTVVTPTVANPPAVTGVYEYDYVPTMYGPHRYTFASTGPTVEYGPALFDVSSTARGLVSVQDMKALPSMNIKTSAWDETLRLFIEAATDVIERHTGRTVVRKAVTETVKAEGGGLWLGSRPILSVTSLTDPNGSAVSVGGLVVDSSMGLIRTPAGARWCGLYTVTVVAGMTTIPANYALAARIIVEHLWLTQRGTMSVAATPGGFDDPPSPSGMGFAIPARALQLLGPSPPMCA